MNRVDNIFGDKVTSILGLLAGVGAAVIPMLQPGKQQEIASIITAVLGTLAGAMGGQASPVVPVKRPGSTDASGPHGMQP